MKEVKTARNTGLRFSFPPYYVGTVEAGLPICSLPGELYRDLERGFAPSAVETRATLLGLRGKLRWSRAMLASFLGVSRDVVRRWETGERKPNGAARRLIWLLGMLVSNRKNLETGLDLIFWGRRNT